METSENENGKIDGGTIPPFICYYKESLE